MGNYKERQIKWAEQLIIDYEQRIKLVSDNIKKNDTKANRRAQRLMVESLEELKTKF